VSVLVAKTNMSLLGEEFVAFVFGRQRHGRVTFDGGSESAYAVNKSSIESHGSRKASSGRGAKNDMGLSMSIPPELVPLEYAEDA
jgi:hypothetical protein